MATRRTRSSAHTKRISKSADKTGSVARKFAHGTLLAAGMVATQMGGTEMDARFHLFSPTLVDRLQAPISRHHE